MSIEAMKQALEALEYIDNNYMSLPKVGNEAITSLRTAIEQAAVPEAHKKQEPVAWMDGYCNIYSLEEKAAGCVDAVIPLVPAIQHWSDCAVHNEPAYPKGDCACGGYTAPPAAPVQEPTDACAFQIELKAHLGGGYPYPAWVNTSEMERLVSHLKKVGDRITLYTHPPYVATPLAAPVQDIEHCIWARNGNTPCPHTAAQRPVAEPHKWVGLTDEEISACDPQEECWGLHEAVRRAEAKLREKNSSIQKEN